MEPEFRTNLPRKKSLHPQTPEERLYEPEGVGLTLRKGDEVENALSFSHLLSLTVQVFPEHCSNCFYLHFLMNYNILGIFLTKVS